MLIAKNTSVASHNVNESAIKPQKWNWQDIWGKGFEAWDDRLNTFMSHFPIAIWTADRERNYSFVSTNIEKILEVSPKDMYIGGGTYWARIIHPDDREKVEGAYDALFTEGIPYDMEYRIKNRSGSWIWIHDRAHDTYVKEESRWADGILTNITKRRNFEEELKKATRELTVAKIKLEQDNAYDEALLESIGDGVIVIDKNGKTLYINEQTVDLLGYSAAEIIGRNWADVVTQAKDKHGNLLPVEKRAIYLAISTKKKVVASYYLVRKNKTAVPVAITASPVILDGELIGSIVVFRDITRETEIDRMKTDFLSIAAHQLRTPLGNMRWNLELLLGGDVGEVNDQVKSVIEQIYASNQRIIALVNDLLNVSRIEQGRVQNIPVLTDIHAIITAVVGEMNDAAKEKGVGLDLRLAPAIAKIMIDQKRFREVFQNLLSNALKYSHRDGKVTVTTAATGNHLTISVTDTGIGIPKQDYGKIFTKFFRAENASLSETDGTGLGLYIVKSFVEAWNGRVWFESQEGKGTTFNIEIPMNI